MNVLNKALKSLQTGINSFVTGLKEQSASKIIINNKEYIENGLIAEGGFSYIYSLTSKEDRKEYALKRISFSSKDQLKQIKNEIKIWQQLQKNKHIVHLYEYELTEDSVFILMELSKEGTLLKYILNQKEKLKEIEALKIIYQIASGLNYMHSQNPPIAHRDMKIENILKFGNTFKICDFGSCSTFVLDPNKEDPNVINKTFTSFEKNSTLYYRPPEMLDMYSKYIVNEKVDIWALGCILYAMIFKKHPFQDAQKLTIISGDYVIPRNDYSEKLNDFIRVMLTPNPMNRPSIKQVIEIIQNWNKGGNIILSDEVVAIKQKQINNMMCDIASGDGQGGKNNLMSEDDIKEVQAMMVNKWKNKGKGGDLFDFEENENKNEALDTGNINSNKGDGTGNAGVAENTGDAGNNNDLFEFEWVGEDNKNSSDKGDDKQQNSIFSYDKSETNTNNTNNNKGNEGIDLFSFDFVESKKEGSGKDDEVPKDKNKSNDLLGDSELNVPETNKEPVHDNNLLNIQDSTNQSEKTNKDNLNNEFFNFGISIDNNVNVNINPLEQKTKNSHRDKNNNNNNTQDILSFFS